jgi:GntR family phosphonate transport system transcriptional regulator
MEQCVDSNDLIQPRHKGTSIWKQIENTLRSEIMAGEIAPGQRLPSEAELAERFGVNRHTVRRAMAELSTQDIVQVENGRGAFVTERVLSYKIDKRMRSPESMLRRGHDMVVKVLKAAEEKADDDVAVALNLAPGTAIWVIDSLSTIDKRPMICARHSFPAERFPGFLQRYRKAKSLSAALKTYGVESSRKSMVVAAMLGAPADLQLLGLEPPTPILAVTSVYVDQNGIPVDVGTSRFAGDRIELELD